MWRPVSTLGVLDTCREQNAQWEEGGVRVEVVPSPS